MLRRKLPFDDLLSPERPRGYHSKTEGMKAASVGDLNGSKSEAKATAPEKLTLKRSQVTFLLAGLIAGLICVAPGMSPIILLTLTWGVGPLFFIAVVASIFITGERRHIPAGFLLYLIGFICCFLTYLAALVVFFIVFGYSPDWFGFRPSQSLENFGPDTWLGLITAGAVGAFGITLFASILTGRWSKVLLQRLALAGLLTVVVTFIANLPFHHYWSFFGVLFPLGNALFCWVVGMQISRNYQVADHGSMAEVSGL